MRASRGPGTGRSLEELKIDGVAAKRAQQERLTARPVRFNARVLEEGEQLRRLLLANARSMTGGKRP